MPTLIVLLSLLLVSLSAQAEGPVTPEDRLMAQVRAGEARNKDDLIEDSLYRLFKVAPDHPEGLAALARLRLRQNKPQEAQSALEHLEKVAPGSQALSLVRLDIELDQPKKKSQLLQARLLARAGRYDEALKLYDELFKPGLPSPEYELEYWQAVANTPQGHTRALQGIQSLVNRYPQSGNYRLALVRQRLDLNRYDPEAYKDLEKLSQDPYARQGASAVWLDQLQRMPVEDRAVTLWKRYLESYPDAAPIAHEGLAAQQQLLANPTFRAKQRAQQLLEQDSQDYAAIERALQQALKGFPNDSDALGNLGRLRQREGRHQDALAFYQRALASEQNIDQRAKWQSLINTAQFWATLNDGDTALRAGNYTAATKAYQNAARLQPRAVEPLTGLADVYAAQGDTNRAEQTYKRALAYDRRNGPALRGLINLYLQQNQIDTAKSLIASLPQDQRQRYTPELNRIQANILSREADAHAAKGQWATAEHKLTEALELQPQDPWLAYNLARARAALGNPKAEDAFANQLRQRSTDPVLRYAHALFLDSQDQAQRALGSLRQVPANQWSEDMHSLAYRLDYGLTLAQARDLNNQGRTQDATALLEKARTRFPKEAGIPLLLGEWSVLGGHPGEAKRYYRAAQVLEPDNIEAGLSLAELAHQQSLDIQARRQLAELSSKAATAGQQRRMANLWSELGEPEKAAAYMNAALEVETRDPLLWRDAARFARRNQQPDLALDRYRQAMRTSNMGDPGQNDAQFTRQTRVQPDDDWLNRSIRSDTAELYQQQTATATLQYDAWDSSGTPGISDLKAHDLRFEADHPLRDGKGFFRAETITMDNGSLGNIIEQNNFGSVALCQTREECSRGPVNQRAQGTSLAVGWRGQDTQWDVGTTPLGFPVQDIVGGVRLSGDLESLGWTMDISRRALSTSLLAYAGTEDPRTGKTWGGVRTNGVSLGLSYDQGGFYGIWSSLQAHRLAGKNVESNDRLRLMSGIYFRLIDEPNRRLRVGSNVMYWHFKENLSGYTFGQGGYYSPQQYLSYSVPINFAQRWDAWSFYAEASASYSWVKEDDADYFPTKSAWQREAGNPVLTGGRSKGLGYRASFSLERRLSPNWFIGTSAGIERSVGSDYKPNQALVYLRYSFAPWEGDLRMPPEPLQEYAQFN
ncbi:cellulose synthase complex outer membrane protein BcsC [Pseudomonas sp. MAG002Y]|uniref:cellulose synthase complex outer membrane protein BcsC n=1 Tax=Pseudomonas sp. MAG002Y TaxID=2678690 RepID=UPI001C60A6E7|nr:cellulose synthase complex outer membrane protein BcsC [Pseudomonas sp. MAG002Y]MBW5413228.1 cellulose biosynthesis protein BcsC [Pseudomonas sp. MAG002Y]